MTPGDKREELLNYLIEQFGGKSIIPQDILRIVREQDKEFISKLKSGFKGIMGNNQHLYLINREINKLAGPALIHSPRFDKSNAVESSPTPEDTPDGLPDETSRLSSGTSDKFDFFEQQDIMSGATSPEEVILEREKTSDKGDANKEKDPLDEIFVDKHPNEKTKKTRNSD